MTLRRLISCTILSSMVAMSPLGLINARASTPPLQPVLLGEIAWAGSSLSTADEWIELWNISDIPLSLAGWSLFGAGESGKTITLPSDAVIPAHGTYLISNYNSEDIKSALQTQDNLVTTIISLSNSNQQIQLLNADGVMVDQAGDGSAPLAGTSLPIKSTMLRTKTDAAGSSKESWTSSALSQNIKADIVDLGTPGFCDAEFVSTDILIDEQKPETEANATTNTVIQETSYELNQLPSEVPSEAGSQTDPIPTRTTDESSTSSESVSPTPITEDSWIQEVINQPSSTTTLEEYNGSVSTLTSSTSDTEVIQTEEFLLIPQTNDQQTTEVAIVQNSTANEENTIIAATIENVVTNSALTLTSDSTQQPTATTAIEPNYDVLRLNEVLSNPTTGKEWVEITSLDLSQSVSLNDCEIHDATGRILKISNLTLNPTSSSYMALEIPSARLNNGGDVVSLYSPTGKLIDTFTYGETAKDQSWSRYPDATGDWQSTNVATPNDHNFFEEQVAELSVETTTTISPTITQTVVTTSPSTSSSTVVASNQTSSTATVKPVTTNIITTTVTKPPSTAITKPKSSTSTTTLPKTTTVKKTTTAKTTSSVKPIVPITFDMIDSEEFAGIRVRLQGIVGTPPGLMTGHIFVLYNQDGRGIRVKVPTNKKLPNMNERFAVTGNLLFDNKGVPYISMTVKDGFTKTVVTNSLSPKVVDLAATNVDDAWSYIHATGTVKYVKNQIVRIEVDGVDLDVLVKSIVKYRPGRLANGDVVAVHGILDTSNEVPRLLPRQAEEISLIQHSKLELNPTQQNGTQLPAWSPLGAAAGAVALTEGGKKFYRRRKEKQLEDKILDLTSDEK